MLSKKEESLCDILEAIIDTGVVIRADLVVSVANVELMCVGLGAVVSEVSKLQKHLEISKVNSSGKVTLNEQL